MGGAVASWLVCSSPERAVRVRALAGDTVLCSLVRHLTLTVPLSTQECKWASANCCGNLQNCGGIPSRGIPSRGIPFRGIPSRGIPSRGSRNTPSRFVLQKPRISSGSYDPSRFQGVIFVSNMVFTFKKNDKYEGCTFYFVIISRRLYLSLFLYF